MGLDQGKSYAGILKFFPDAHAVDWKSRIIALQSASWRFEKSKKICFKCTTKAKITIKEQVVFIRLPAQILTIDHTLCIVSEYITSSPKCQLFDRFGGKKIETKWLILTDILIGINGNTVVNYLHLLNVFSYLFVVHSWKNGKALKIGVVAQLDLMGELRL